MNMLRAVVCAGIFLACGTTFLATEAAGDDQTKPGEGNASAVALAKKSPIVQSAYQFLLSQAARIQGCNAAQANPGRARRPLHPPSRQLERSAKGFDCRNSGLARAGQSGERRHHYGWRQGRNLSSRTER